MPHQLIELTKWPSMPAPWSSTDAGETWIIGDYFAILQKGPMSVLDAALKMQGKVPVNSGLSYHFALTIFYRLDKNPHGPSHRPVACIAIEQADMNALPEPFRSASGLSGMGPVMIGVFQADNRMNMGEYGGSLDIDSAREILLKYAHKLGFTDPPRLIGNLASAHGNAETRIPPREAVARHNIPTVARSQGSAGPIARVSVVSSAKIEKSGSIWEKLFGKRKPKRF